MTQHELTKAAVSLLLGVVLYGTLVAARQGPPPPELLTTVRSRRSQARAAARPFKDLPR